MLAYGEQRETPVLDGHWWICDSRRDGGLRKRRRACTPCSGRSCRRCTRRRCTCSNSDERFTRYDRRLRRGTAPDGWLLCDGAAVSRTNYATLFGAIGIHFGGGDGI